MQRRSSFQFVFLLFSLALFCAATAIASPAQTLTTLVNLDGTNGANPVSSLVQATDGTFYGTANVGGANGYGTFFNMTAGGTLTALYSFCSQTNCTDGAYPNGLVQATDGNFYATTWGGGSDGNCFQGCGTIFKITAQGTLTVLHNFDAAGGYHPQAGLVQATDGNFYGTTEQGGGSSNCIDGCGTIFKITPQGVLTTLYTFNRTDGAAPFAGLIQAPDGNFYSTTKSGGSDECVGPCACYEGCGTVFKITPGGSLTTLYKFGANGTFPLAGLVQATDGNFYGTTLFGGNSGNSSCFAGCGTIFKVTAQGDLTTLYDFNGQDGSNPQAGLMQAADGNIYGATAYGGEGGNCAEGCGTLFGISTSGILIVLHFFDGTDGGLPEATLVQAADGKLYGTTEAGGAGSSCFQGCGTVFSLSLGGQFPSNPVQFVHVTPCRLVDTRDAGGEFGGPPLQGNNTRSFVIPDNQDCNIPAGAAAYSLNVTMVPHGELRYLTIWPTGYNVSYAPTLISLDGRVKADAAIVPAGNQGAVSFYVSDTTDLVLDIDGYFAVPGDSTLAFYPLAPCRVADTREANGDLGGPYLTGGEPRDFPILEATSCNMPNNARAYSLNFTAVPHGPLGYLSVWPAGQAQPYVSTLNSYGGQIVANAAIVAAGSDGKISTYATHDTDLVIDIDGYFAAPGQGGLSLYPVPPCRVLDTSKVGNGQPFSGDLVVDVVNSACAPLNNAQAYVFNATADPTDVLFYLTLWPEGADQPYVSTLNSSDWAPVSNLAIVPAGSQGQIDAYATNPTQLILDISSYFAP